MKGMILILFVVGILIHIKAVGKKNWPEIYARQCRQASPYIPLLRLRRTKSPKNDLSKTKQPSFRNDPSTARPGDTHTQSILKIAPV